MTRPPRVAVVGATGLVGQTLLTVLGERFPDLQDVRALAESSGGRTVSFAGRALSVEAISEETLDGTEVVFFAATSAVSERFGPWAAARGALVVDKSSRFRMDPEVPLVVPEVNGHLVHRGGQLVASPNCSTIALVLPLFAILRHRSVTRVLVSTYQAVSGTGRDALSQLEAETADAQDGAPHGTAYSKPIAGNVLAQCDRLAEAGYTLEEWKLTRESEKILGTALHLSATAVRVPVRVGHAESVYLELDRSADPVTVREWLRATPGIVVVEDPDYPTPRDAAGTDDVYVGRVRRDLHDPNGLHLFIVADNLRKGAATNAVQILERSLSAETVPS